MTLEKKLEARLGKDAQRNGGIAVKLLPFLFAGLPDRMVLLPGGRMFFAEIKSAKKKPSPRQEIVIAMFRNLGFTVHIVDSEETYNLIEW